MTQRTATAKDKRQIFPHKALQKKRKKRVMGLEPTTFSLATRRSTTELHPHYYIKLNKKFQNLKLQLCWGRELNPYPVKDTHLKRARMPVPPPQQPAAIPTVVVKKQPEYLKFDQ